MAFFSKKKNEFWRTKILYNFFALNSVSQARVDSSGIARWQDNFFLTVYEKYQVD